MQECVFDVPCALDADHFRDLRVCDQMDDLLLAPLRDMQDFSCTEA